MWNTIFDDHWVPRKRRRRDGETRGNASLLGFRDISGPKRKELQRTVSITKEKRRKTE